jgi:hypothetical protein
MSEVSVRKRKVETATYCQPTMCSEFRAVVSLPPGRRWARARAGAVVR